MRYTCTILILLLTMVPGSTIAQQPQNHSAHAGKQVRAIKALSDEEIAAFLKGEGAGFALPAELNHYPGPRHVLDLRSKLALTPQQLDSVTRIFERMSSAARQLGRQIVDKERELDQKFANRSITSESLEQITQEIALYTAELRAVHLDAHLQVTALLTPEQIRRYDMARGYAAKSEHRH